MNLKGFERSRRGLIEVLFGHCPEGTLKNYQKRQWRYPVYNRDSNPASSRICVACLRYVHSIGSDLMGHGSVVPCILSSRHWMDLSRPPDCLLPWGRSLGTRGIKLGEDINDSVITAEDGSLTVAAVTGICNEWANTARLKAEVTPFTSTDHCFGASV